MIVWFPLRRDIKMARRKLTDEEKKIKERELEQKRIEENHKNNLQELINKSHLIPESTYQYALGDKVTIGNLENVYVCGIHENGKIYEINYSSTDNNYGNPITTHNHKVYVKWVDIRKCVEDKSSLIKNIDLRLSYMQMSTQSIFSKAYYFGINFEPEYQREYVWELQDKINLIDSIFNNIDIGKFVFIHYDTEKWRKTGFGYEILDGKQRIRAILDYYEDRFKYNGKYFSDLSYRDQYHFEDYPISVAEMRNITHEQALRYFIKLNTCGKIMSEEQIDKVRKLLEQEDK
jgi:hypothetical protein